MILGSLFENVTIDGLFCKNLPKDIRGTLNGAYNFFGNIGVLIFSSVAGYLYDHIGPNVPFAVVGVCDIIFAFGVICLRLSGKFN